MGTKATASTKPKTKTKTKPKANAKTKPKPKTSKASPYAVKLDKFEAQLAKATSGQVLGALAREFHMIGYSLGHDLPAIIGDPSLVDRATRGKVTANEHASAAHERAGNIRHALFHLFEGLDAFPGPADRKRLAERIAAVLDTYGPAIAKQLRSDLAALPGGDGQASRQRFYDVIGKAKQQLDWESLPRG